MPSGCVQEGRKPDMGVIAGELPLKVSADRMYATLKDVHNLLPKIVPDFISKFEIVEGDGGVGTVRKITFGSVVSQEPSTALEKIVDVNDEKKSVTYELVEGQIKKMYSKFVATAKYEPSDEGCVAFWSAEYEPVAEGIPPPEQAREAIFTSMKAVEAYLLATPDAYVIAKPT